MTNRHFSTCSALLISVFFLVGCEQEYGLATFGGDPLDSAPNHEEIGNGDPTIVRPAFASPTVVPMAPDNPQLPGPQPGVQSGPLSGTEDEPQDDSVSNPVSPAAQPQSANNSESVAVVPSPSGQVPATLADGGSLSKGRKVIVNVAVVVVTMRQSNSAVDKRTVVAENLGKLDLLQLPPEVLGSFQAESGSVLQEVELRLHADGHELIENGVVVCGIKVPGQKVQLKLHGTEIRSGIRYSIKMPQSEIAVHPTAQGCNLRPVAFPALNESTL
ncbi:MAG: hypothetical protein A2X94_06185 [Bdellovibrionales bacterium GWB1_55_8]|nr:MAG: hypothetical protein A2X94_06185 [Bdellovibrionales bacterium GWB1_55_8]